MLADLNEPGARWLAAHGGRGGRGNARFLSNRRRAPSFAEQGELGEEAWYDLELKLMADVALVGFPNSGKSHAHFAHFGGQAENRQLPVHHTRTPPRRGPLRRARVRGGGHPRAGGGGQQGKGLGHRFLRHIERARALLVLVDLAPDDGRRPEEQELALLAELERYQPDLARPARGWWLVPELTSPPTSRWVGGRPPGHIGRNG